MDPIFGTAMLNIPARTSELNCSYFSVGVADDLCQLDLELEWRYAWWDWDCIVRWPSNQRQGENWPGCHSCWY